MLSYLIFALWIPIIRHYKTKVSAQILLCISKDICSNGSCGASLSSHRIISHTLCVLRDSNAIHLRPCLNNSVNTADFCKLTELYTEELRLASGCLVALTSSVQSLVLCWREPTVCTQANTNAFLQIHVKL